MPCKRLLLRESQVQPLLVVFEDLHWIDTETQALLDSLVESLPIGASPAAGELSARVRAHAGAARRYSQLRLDPLPAESAEELLAALLGEHAGARAAEANAGRRTRGQSVLPGGERPDPGRDGRARRRARGYRLTRPVEALQVPATVQAMLAARIDRLPPEESGCCRQPR